MNRILLGMLLVLAGCSTAPKSAPENSSAQKSESQKSAAQKPGEETKPIFQVDPATAATITGNVHFSGKRPAAPQKIDISEDADCVRMNPKGLYDESLVVSNTGEIRNAFVFISEGLEDKNFERSTTPVVLDQKGCHFSPHVLGMEPGQPLQVTNSDPVTHNVHPLAQSNYEWNQSQAPGDPPVQRKFARREVMMRVKCNIHSWMRSWIGVLDHPYFAVTAADGSFRIPNLPPGDYTIQAWHETLGKTEQKLHVGASETKTVKFTFNGA